MALRHIQDFPRATSTGEPACKIVPDLSWTVTTIPCKEFWSCNMEIAIKETFFFFFWHFLFLLLWCLITFETWEYTKAHAYCGALFTRSFSCVPAPSLPQRATLPLLLTFLRQGDVLVYGPSVRQCWGTVYWCHVCSYLLFETKFSSKHFQVQKGEKKDVNVFRLH